MLTIFTNTTFLFLSLSLFLFIFVFWSEGRRDGFDKYQLFDIIFTLFVLSGLLNFALGRWYGNLQVYHYDSLFLRIDHKLYVGFLVYMLWVSGIWAFAKQFSWSFYRLLDVFATSQVFLGLGLVLWAVLFNKNFTALIPFVCYLVLYKIFFVNMRISGVNFALVTSLHAFFTATLLNLTGRLPIALLLLTISILVVYFRRKISMSKTNLPQDFLNLIKSALTKKDSELVKQEKVLKAEDPYLQPGRADGNSESMDEAILEDVAKEITDVQVSLLRKARAQIKRALAFMKLGKYGVCEICGEQIDPARLRFYPEATKCMRHAELSEK